jgi:hypothetical protein
MMPKLAQYSTTIDLWLEGSWGRQPLRQVADRFIMGNAEFAVPPGPAEVVVTIDGREVRHPVQLPEGYRLEQSVTPITPDDEIPI